MSNSHSPAPGPGTVGIVASAVGLLDRAAGVLVRRVHMRQNLARAVILVLGLGLVAFLILQPFKDRTPSTAWSAVNTGGGGWVTGMVTGPTGEVYSRTDVGGAYRWSQATETWSQMLIAPAVPDPTADDYNVESLAVAGSDGKRVYLAVGGALDAAEGRILASTDAGISWRDGGTRFKIHGNAEWRWAGERLSVDPANPDVVLFGSRTEGLWRSEDGTRTWTRTAAPSGVSGDGDPAGVMFTLFDPRSAVVGGKTQGAWAGVQNIGILRTDDAGATWRILHPVVNGVPRDAEVAADGTLYVVVNGPSSSVLRVDRSNRVTDVSPDDGGAFAMVAIDPLNPARVFIGDDGVRDGRLWRSLDGGASWTALNIALTSPRESWATTVDIDRWMSGGALAFDPARPGRLWFAEGMGMWRSTDLSDSEVTWSFASGGIEELVSNAAVKPPGRPLITASWDRGLFRHPTPKTGGAYPPYRKPFGSAWDITSSPTDPDFLAAVLDDHQDPSGASHPDRRASGYSRDGGASWTRFSALANGTAPADLKFGNIAVSATDTNNLVWVPSNLDTPKIYYTTDRGASWLPSRLTGAVSGDYLHRAHYLKRRIPAADPLTAGVFYALGGNQDTGSAVLWKTTDGGASWAKVTTTGLDRPGYSDFRFNSSLVAIPGEPGHLFALAGPTDDGNRPFWRSTDGGVTWVQKSNLVNAHALGVGAPMGDGGHPTLFTVGSVGGQHGVYRSSDLGDSWTFLVDHPRGWYQSVTSVVGDPEVPGKVYVGFSGGGFVMGQLDRGGRWGS